jgi:hypothetical protein
MSDYFPGRPSHPDFAVLSTIVIGQDEASHGDGFDFGSHVAGFIDTRSLTYMAEQRARRMVDQVRGPLTRDGLVAAIAAAYLDGFMAGCLFNGQKEVGQ